MVRYTFKDRVQRRVFYWRSWKWHALYLLTFFGQNLVPGPHGIAKEPGKCSLLMWPGEERKKNCHRCKSQSHPSLITVFIVFQSDRILWITSLVFHICLNSLLVYWYFLSYFFPFIFISWRLITLQYCSGFCHTLTWISHGFTCIPRPDPPSTRSLWVFPVHHARALVSCIQPGLVICFTLDVSMLDLKHF